MKTRYNAKTQKYETLDKAAQDKYELTLMGIVLIPILIVGVAANWGKSYPAPRSAYDDAKFQSTKCTIETGVVGGRCDINYYR
jgi:hypothetical protein